MSMGLGDVCTVSRLNLVIEPVETERAHVDCTARRSENKHEAEKILGVPLLWAEEVFFVHVIPRNGDLGYVIKKVLNEYLEASHRVVR